MNNSSVYFLKQTTHTSYQSMVYKPTIKKAENITKCLKPKNSHGCNLYKASQNKFSYKFTFKIFL